MKNLTWQNPEQLFVAQELINKVKSKCCGIKDYMPQQESRVKKLLLNARVNLIFYFLTLILSFFSRKIFLDTLGADFVGLTGTLQNLLGFLNLAELGIYTAIGYVLYKPLFEHDEIKISEIVSVLGYLYKWVGFIILGAGIVLACFLPLIFPNTEFEMGIIFFAYFSFLASSLIGYFANYKQTLLGADQKNYVVTAYFQTATIVKTLIQMASAYYTGSYYLWVAIELTFGIIYSFILNWKINQVYPWLRSEVRLGKQLFKKYPEVMKYTKQLFVHKIGGLVQYQAAPILIYSFVSLKMVAYYGNYSIVIDKVQTLINSLFTGIEAGIGNLIAEGNQIKIEKVFWEINSVRYYIAGFVIFLIYHLVNPFVFLWLGEEYILSNTVVVIILLNTYLRISNGYNASFLFGYGLFYDTWAPLTEAAINIVIAIVCGSIWGLSGVLLGNVISFLLIVCIWKPFFLYWKGFKKRSTSYWFNILKYLAILAVSWYSFILIDKNFITVSPNQNYKSLIFYAVIITFIFGVIFSLMMFAVGKGFRSFTCRFFKIEKWIKI